MPPDDAATVTGASQVLPWLVESESRIFELPAGPSWVQTRARLLLWVLPWGLSAARSC